MYRHTLGALCVVSLAGAGLAEAEGISASLSDLVRQSDRVVVGRVESMQTVIEVHVASVKDGQPITGRFVFTYVDLVPTEHLVGAPSDTLTVRLLGGVHPGGTKFTTYPDAPAVSSTERVLLFLKGVPERGPDNEMVHQIAFHRAGKFRVEGDGANARLVRPLPNSGLEIDPQEGIGEGPIDLDRMRALIRDELVRGG